MPTLTPMMQQYVDTKKEYHDCILFYRLGDFYEMFFEDANVASKELEITLTGKSCGLEERAPMCGVPYHAAESYINRLVERGYKVAICEQIEDAKEAKGLVKRDVIRIVTPGTNCNMTALDETKNNYLVGIAALSKHFGFCAVDVTTGDFFVTELDNTSKVLDEINKFMPSEIICNDAFFSCDIDMTDLTDRLNIALSALAQHYFDKTMCSKSLCKQFQVSMLDGLGLGEYSVGIIAAGCVMQYLEETQKCSLAHLIKLTPYSTSEYMLLDRNTRRNLELVETLREKQKKGTLLWVLDKTKTAMGARELRKNIEQPFINKSEIEKRYDVIEELNEQMISREECREYLAPIYDLERLLSKISYKSVNPRDLIALRSSLEMLPHIRTVCSIFSSELMKYYMKHLDPMEDLVELICGAIDEEPPIALREGGIIKSGYREEVDRLRNAKKEGKNWLAELEHKEKESTGIKNLKIKFNKVFGYYLEVTNSYQELVPEHWTRKQTLANAERYTTTELKELEDIILGAEDKLYQLEYSLFCEIRETIFSHVTRIQQSAKMIACIDMMTSLAYVAEHEHYTRPTINIDGKIDIKEGRHPVIEKMIDHDLFIANDICLDDESHRVVIITGPNMAGKSTYMRQTALITLMAQMGSFVPAKKADISIVDRIFTRVGASDDLASGQSTFMMEMTEVANILRNATNNSLIILDEIGRGTSTFDGLSIAWAVVEHINNKKILGAKTLFATHYHELTELEGKLDGVQNYCIAVKEDGDDIVFLRKIIKGGADRSYGIQVAKLAGVPEQILERAKKIASRLEEADSTKKYEGDLPVTSKKTKKQTNIEMNQLSIFDLQVNKDAKTEDILHEICDTDLTNVTPLDAMNLIHQWQKKLNSL